MDAVNEWYVAVKDWQKARDDLSSAIAAIHWPHPTQVCLDAYDRAYSRETLARDRMQEVCGIGRKL